MEAKLKARLEALGIKVRSGTQEEADSLGITMFSGPRSEISKQPTQAPDEEQQMLHQKYLKGMRKRGLSPQ